MKRYTVGLTLDSKLVVWAGNHFEQSTCSVYISIGIRMVFDWTGAILFSILLQNSLINEESPEKIILTIVLYCVIMIIGECDCHADCEASYVDDME